MTDTPRRLTKAREQGLRSHSIGCGDADVDALFAVIDALRTDLAEYQRLAGTCEEYRYACPCYYGCESSGVNCHDCDHSKADHDALARLRLAEDYA